MATLQALSVASATATLLLAWLVARKLGASRREASAVTVVLAVIPTYAFHANVGFSDLPGTAAALGAAWLLLRSWEDLRLLPFAGAAVAASVAIRPQLVLALVPLGIAALVQAVRRRRWGALLLALVAGTAVSAMCWVPAVVITGPQRFRQALADTGRWIAEKEPAWRFPGAPLGVLVRQWLVFPWATTALAVAFWLLVLAGTVAWWRNGRRRLVAVAIAVVACYLPVGVATMNMAESVRYVLPALPFLALLAGGVVAPPRSQARRLGQAALAGWSLLALVWMAPTLELRHRDPAPVWEGLTWVAANCDPARATAVFDGAFKPHVAYLLRSRGFHTEERRTGIAYANFLPGGSVVFVTRDPQSVGEVVLQRSWAARGLAPLTRGLYERCFVAKAPTDTWVHYSPTIRVVAAGWQLERAGEVRLADDAPAQLLLVPAGDRKLVVSLAGQPPVEALPGHQLFVPLPPGQVNAVTITVAGGGLTQFPGLEVLPVGREDWRWLAGGPASRELFVPSAAHISGRLQSLWVTDLLLRNPDGSATATVSIEFAPEVNPPGRAATRSRTLAPGETALLRDVLASELGVSGRGALRIVADRPFGVLWRTYDKKLPHTLADPAFLRGLLIAQAVRHASLPLRFRSGATGLRSNAGFLNPTAEPIEIRFTLTRDGRTGPLGPRTLRLAGRSFDQLDDDELLGKEWRFDTRTIEIEFAASAPVFAFSSLIENDSNRATFVLAGEPGAEAKAAAVGR